MSTEVNPKAITIDNISDIIDSIRSVITKDNKSATAIGTSENLITERSVYYGLPNINGSHSYNSSTTLYMPTSAGTNGYELISNGSGAPVWRAPQFASCSTASSTQTKAVTIAGFKLVTGVCIRVKFIYEDTSASAKLNVNSTGDKFIKYKDKNLTSGDITAGSIYELTYDGSYWVITDTINDNKVEYTSSLLSGTKIGTISIDGDNTDIYAPNSTYTALPDGGININSSNQISVDIPVATTSANGLMSSSDKTKLNGIASYANNYTHPSTHAASMITQDSTHRFVSDTEKTTWNNKISPDTDADGDGYLWSDIATNFICLDNTLSSHGFAGASEVMMFLAYLTWNYGTCSTSAATSAKTVTLSHFSDNSGAGLWNGNRVFIKFTYANTASSPTLNINGLGAKTIKWGNTTSRTNNYMWQAGEVVEFVYDGTYWVAISSTSATQGYFTDNVTIKNNTNYGTKLNFGDGDYVHIAEVYDDAMELKGSNIHLGIETSKAVWLQSSNSSTTKYKVVGTSTGYNTKIHVATSQPSTMSVGDIWFKIPS